MSNIAYFPARPSPEDNRPGKRERTKVANRQAILDAARAVFGELGYEAATVRDIIRRTGLASGTFYNYYKSKEEVFDALADDGARRFRPILRAESDKAVDFESFLRGAIRAYFDFLGASTRAGGSTGRPARSFPTPAPRPRSRRCSTRSTRPSPRCWSTTTPRPSIWTTSPPPASPWPARSATRCWSAGRSTSTAPPTSPSG
jgi:AcrR family transcriptional regulator